MGAMVATNKELARTLRRSALLEKARDDVALTRPRVSFPVSSPSSCWGSFRTSGQPSGDIFRWVLIGLVLLFSPWSTAQARPEKVEPGVSYYSDEILQQGLVPDIGGEKNLEEVYQFYTYYEVIYDDRERVVIFIEYRRGEVLRREQYVYDESGKASKVAPSPPPGPARD